MEKNFSSSIDSLELTLPNASSKAFQDAKRDALDAGLSVMVAKGAGLFQESPDGTAKFVKLISPPEKAHTGKKYRLK